MARTVHGVTWKDELAWMEEMKGDRWNTLLHKHQERWEEKIKGLEKEIQVLEKEYQKEISEHFHFGTDQLRLKINGTLSLLWKINSKIHEASAIEVYDKYPDLVWAVEPSSDGSEFYTLVCYNKEIPIWKKGGVGPFVTVIDGRVYAIEAKNKLIYYKLVSWNVKGEDKQTHYEEKDYRYNLELLSGSSSKGFLRRQAGAKQDLLTITKEGIKADYGISLESRRFIIDKGNPENIFIYEKGIWNKPIPGKQTIELLNSSLGLFITKSHGVRTIWKQGREVWKGVGTVTLDPLGSHWVNIITPTQDIWWDSRKSFPEIQKKLIVQHIHVKGDLYYVFVSNVNKPKNILLTGYGAYGIPTSMNMKRWNPLLKRGWGIVIALLRGGGDHTPEWEDAGRCHGREDVLKDAEDILHHIRQAHTANICLYGRSAGGLWVGGMVAKHPKGDLFEGAYMEVPYLDVLRTTTTPSLPLTLIETDEFGNPNQRLSDFASVIRWSPMELLKTRPEVFQIVRTGLNDSEVYAYESVKWIERSGQKTFLAVEDGQGHFVSGSKNLRQRAEDLAVLLNTFDSSK